MVMIGNSVFVTLNIVKISNKRMYKIILSL